MFGLWNYLKRRWGRGRKAIFQFWDGTAWRYADPMMAIRGLQTHPRFVWSQHPIAVAAGDFEALAICAEAVRDVFGIKPFHGGTGDGLTVQECFELLVSFCEYLDTLKKNGNPSRTPSEPTEPVSSISTTSPGTNDTSASSPSPGEPSDSAPDSRSP